MPLEKNTDDTWKYHVGVGIVGVFLFIVWQDIFKSSNDRLDESDKRAAQVLCQKYIAQQMYKPASIVETQHIKYDGSHFVKAFYYRSDDNKYFEYVCSLDNNKIIWAGVHYDSETGQWLGRWRFEYEMKYRKNKSGSWILY